MSLLRLLSIGRSLMGLSKEPVRYRMEQNFLPRFEAAKEGEVGTTAAPVSSSGRRSFFQSRFSGQNRPRSTRSWVQGELALGSIKVVRNDLSEADVELVPVKAGSRRDGREEGPHRVRGEEIVRVEQSGKLSAAPAKVGRNRGWSELTARLFESGVLRT